MALNTAPFDFVKGVANNFEKNDAFQTVAVTKNGKELMKDIYTCNGFHLEVYFKYDSKCRATSIDTIYIAPTKFLPLEFNIEKSTEGKGKPTTIVITLQISSRYPNYNLDFIYAP